MVTKTLLKVSLVIPLGLSGCQGNSQSMQAIGTLEWDRIELVAEAAEPITEIFVHEGDKVSVGQKLLQLDARRFQAQMDEAVAAREQAAARLAELVRGPRPQAIAEARARLAGAEQVARARKKDYQRLRSLLAKKLSSQEQVDNAKALSDAAHADRDAARAKLEQLLVGTTNEELEQARQALARSDAARETLRLTLERLTVRAPQAGRVDSLPFQVGERPAAGLVVATVLGGSAPYARVYVPEKERVHISGGTEADVYVDGIAQPFSARVRTVSSDPTFTPFFALTKHDRGRLSYVAKVELLEKNAAELPAGVPVRVVYRNARTSAVTVSNP